MSDDKPPFWDAYTDMEAHAYAILGAHSILDLFYYQAELDPPDKGHKAAIYLALQALEASIPALRASMQQAWDARAEELRQAA